ncbi:MAG: pyridoxal-phosphate dependent enzyme [Cyclobacteriaceae bacterium]
MVDTLTIDEQLSTKTASLASHIGNTPLFKVDGLHSNPNVEIYAKLEWQQMGGSVKARPAYDIIQNAIQTGQLGNGRVLLDASSGNTAIAYASIAAALGIQVEICLPANASQERKNILQRLGANLTLTSEFGGTDDAQQVAREMYHVNPEKYFYADQYNNQNNWRAHYKGTGHEIWNQTNGTITHFVSALGTTGTFTGTTRRLKKLNHEITSISLQPDGPMHGLEGWKHLETAIVPGIYDSRLANEDWGIDTADAYQLIPQIASRTGLLVSPSSAANLAGAIKLSDQINEGVIVTMFPDNAEKYSEVMTQIFNQ